MKRIAKPLFSRFFLKVALAGVLSILFLASRPAYAHEISPAVVDFRVEEQTLVLEVALSLEAILAGVDLETSTNTAEAGNSDAYDDLRALSAAELEVILWDQWTSISPRINMVLNDISQNVTLKGSAIPAPGDLEVERISTLTLWAPLPGPNSFLQFGWHASYGELILRQADVSGGFVDYVKAGELSPPIPVVGYQAKSGWQSFLAFIPVGFDHILPKGLDHILFVVGLFLFSTRLRPLLLQITAFTAAHTITLGLASLGWITVSASIVEPLIAVSIVYVAVENILAAEMKRWRVLLIFGFGLLHGLGFASVLRDFGLPEQGFIPALLGFNLGVELGQITVILGCFLLIGLWFGNRSWYRNRLSVPLSVVVAGIGGYWAIERVFL